MEQRRAKHLQHMTPPLVQSPQPQKAPVPSRGALPGDHVPRQATTCGCCFPGCWRGAQGCSSGAGTPGTPSRPPDPAVHTFIPAVQLALLTPEILSLSKQPCIKSRIQEWK